MLTILNINWTSQFSLLTEAFEDYPSGFCHCHQKNHVTNREWGSEGEAEGEGEGGGYDLPASPSHGMLLRVGQGQEAMHTLDALDQLGRHMQGEEEGVHHGSAYDRNSYT